VVLGFLAVIIFGIPYWTADRIRIDAWPRYQQAQFHSMEAAIGLFKGEFNIYPPSDANDPAGKPYCGAMKLAEAMMGQDVLGFHSKSVFRADGKDAGGAAELYDPTDLTVRKGPFLPPESADTYSLTQIYGKGKTGPFDPEERVLCDTFKRKFKGRRVRAGMPILYYRADISKTAHDVNNPDNPDNMYDYRDNHALLALGVPGEPEKKHPLFTDPKLFYKIAKQSVDNEYSEPNTYILISAGKDGLYGTADDICNFEWKFPQNTGR
jgi:hypothetical protein